MCKWVSLWYGHANMTAAVYPIVLTCLYAYIGSFGKRKGDFGQQAGYLLIIYRYANTLVQAAVDNIYRRTHGSPPRWLYLWIHFFLIFKDTTEDVLFLKQKLRNVQVSVTVWQACKHALRQCRSSNRTLSPACIASVRKRKRDFSQQGSLLCTSIRMG